MSLGPSPSRRRRFRFVGVGLVLVGLVLLGGSIAYFLYGFKARSDLGKLSYTPTPPAWELAGAPELGELAQARGSNPDTSREGSADSIPSWAIWEQAAYPGEYLRARYWSESLSYEPQWTLDTSLLEGFEPVDPDTVPAKHSLLEATRIIIPSIDVDSSIEPLQINDLGDSREYETPKHVVGHIPETANAGEAGTTWLFGHLESPIKGEGSVFRDLPEIPAMLYKGEDVFAVLEGESGAFLYKLTSSEVLPEDAVRLYDTGTPTLRLVTCVPALYYDHRLIVWGELVGVRS